MRYKIAPIYPFLGVYTKVLFRILITRLRGFTSSVRFARLQSVPNQVFYFAYSLQFSAALFFVCRYHAKGVTRERGFILFFCPSELVYSCHAELVSASLGNLKQVHVDKPIGYCFRCCFNLLVANLYHHLLW